MLAPMKKLIAVAILAPGLRVPASSSSAEPSPCGAAHGAFTNVNGNFGWLGELGGTPGYRGAVGQEEGPTGYNNSGVNCRPE